MWKEMRAEQQVDRVEGMYDDTALRLEFRIAFELAIYPAIDLILPYPLAYTCRGPYYIF